MTDNFWLVWRRYHRVPKFRHDSLASAQAEAERLSAEYPLGAFFVLEAVQQVGPGLEGPPTPQPKKAKQPPPPELTPEQRAEKAAAKAARAVERRAAYEAKTGKKATLPPGTPVKAIHKLRRTPKQKDESTEVKPALTLRQIREESKK